MVHAYVQIHSRHVHCMHTSIYSLLWGVLFEYNNNIIIVFSGSCAGNISIAALKEGRNAICIVENEEDVSNVVVQMSALESTE